MTKHETILYELQDLKVQLDEVKQQIEDLNIELGELQMWKKLIEDAGEEHKRYRIAMGQE
jgi:prefoldin subunit 5